MPEKRKSPSERAHFRLGHEASVVREFGTLLQEKSCEALPQTDEPNGRAPTCLDSIVNQTAKPEIL